MRPETYREDIVFADTPNRKCTLNQPDHGRRLDTLVSPAKGSVEPGAYSGRGQQEGVSVTFVVPAGAGSVLNFSVPGSAAPGHRLRRSAAPATPRSRLAPATVRPDRSFTATVSRSGVVNRANAKVTYLHHRVLPRVRTPRGRPPRPGCTARTSSLPTHPTATCTSNNQTVDSGSNRVGRARGHHIGKDADGYEEFLRLALRLLVQLVHHTADHQDPLRPRDGPDLAVDALSAVAAFNVSEAPGAGRF